MYKSLVKQINSYFFFKRNFRSIYTGAVVSTECKPKTSDNICPPAEKIEKPCKLGEGTLKKQKKEKDPPIEKQVDAVKKEKKPPVKEIEEDIKTEPLISENYNHAKVVIIGGGIAGLAAAKFFEENNIKNYVVLEAMDRLGGRIQTQWFGDTLVELGPSCEKSDFLRPFLLEAIADRFISSPAKYTSIFMTCDGKIMNDAICQIAYELFKCIYIESLNLETDQLDFIEFRIRQELSYLAPRVRQDAARVMLGMLVMLEKRIGDKSEFIMSEGSGTYLKIPEGSLKVPLGFYGILHPMLDSVPSHKLILKKPVQNIRWGAVVCKDTPRALVKCCDGSVFPADYVLITVSLGVLKETSDSLFCPALPADKVDALKSIGFHHVNHLYFKFDEPFWSWTKNEINLKFKGKDLDGRNDWTRGITKIRQMPDSEKILMVQVAGRHAIMSEKVDHIRAFHSVVEILNNKMDLLCIPSCKQSVRSNWSSNVYFNGAYSYLPKGLSEEIQHSLAAPLPGCNAPVNPILFFAGEATCPRLHATVQGARISGIREATNIKRLIINSAAEMNKNLTKMAMLG